MDQYFEKPNEEQHSLLTDLFAEWSRSGNQALLNHLVEIIESHESNVIRELALNALKVNFPTKKLGLIVETWITHPAPSIKEYIKELVSNKRLKKPLLAAAYVMLDDWDTLEKIDPDYKHLDNYLKDLDPLLGSLLFDRVSKLKNPELGEYLQQDKKGDNNELSIMDLIRRKDHTLLWDNILEYPLPFICELFKIFNLENWSPKDKSSSELFEILIEQLGVAGWEGIEYVKWQVLSKQDGKKFKYIDGEELRKQVFNLTISQDVIRRPDRIRSHQFKSRGNYSLTDSQIGLNIYKNMIRKSDLDGLLHVPIYTNNGAEVAEFVIPAPSTGSFQMDEDGMFFTIRNKDGLYSVDIDALAALLLPVKNHSEAINEIIPSMLEKADGPAKVIINALNLISAQHRGREYSLWDLKETGKWEKPQNEDNLALCRCSLGLDIGNSVTKVALVVGGKCDHQPKNWIIPSLIHYFTPKTYIIGNEIIEKKLENSSQTFKNWKFGSHHNKYHLRIHNSIITSQTAFENFLAKLVQQIRESINFEVNGIAITHSLDAPAGFEGWLQDLTKSLGFPRFELIDDMSSAIAGTYRLNNQRGNVLLVDMGSCQMSAVVAKLPGQKSRKRKENARMRELNVENPIIIATACVSQGSQDITNIIRNLAFNETERKNLSPLIIQLIDKVKFKLSYEFEAEIELPNYEILKFSLDKKINGDVINVLESFRNSNFFASFKLLIRNILIKAAHRGLNKSNIETILISGKGMHWPPLLEYIHTIFGNKRIISEDDTWLAAKGAGLTVNGRFLEYYMERDVMLKTVSNGISEFNTILSRGDKLSNHYKTYEIRTHARFDKIVIDCWSRKIRFILDEDALPIKDNERLEYRADDELFFFYDQVFRELAQIDDKSLLKVRISSRGKLSFEIIRTDDVEELYTNARLH